MTTTLELHTREDIDLPETSLDPAEGIVGNQVPHLFSAPALNDPFFADTAILWLESIGLHLLPWQKVAVRYALDCDQKGYWSSLDALLLVPRQNGKNVVLTALILIHTYLSSVLERPTYTIVYTAHLFETAKSAFRDVRKIIRANQYLADRTTIHNSNDNLGFTVRRGDDQDEVLIRFMTRSNETARGLSIDLLIVDEAFALTSEMMAGLEATTSARPNAQTVYTSSTGKEDSEPLADLHQRLVTILDGSADPEEGLGFMGMEWTIDLQDEQLQYRSREAAAYTNPSLGYFLRWAQLRKSKMAEEQYKREHLGIWARTSYDPVIAEKVWKNSRFHPEMLADDPIMGQSLALEIPMGRERGYVAGAAVTRSGRIIVDIIASHASVGWMQEVATHHYRTRRPRSGFVIDKAGGAGNLADRLEVSGMKVSRVGYQELGIASAQFYDLITSGPDPRLVHGDNPFLEDAVATAGRRLMGAEKTKWTWKSNANVPVEALRAVTLAVWGLILNPELRPHKH